MATSTDIFCCPVCKRPLIVNRQSLRCEPCQRVFPVVNGVPDLFVTASEGDHIDELNKTWLVPEIVEARDTYYRLCTRELRGMRYCMAEIGARTVPGCRVLEVGMGTGHFTRWLAEVSQPGTEIFAFDFSWPIIEKAIANTLGLSGVNILRANARGRLPLRDGAFDIVFLRLAPLGAHGIPNVVAALELLKPGGWFFEAGWKRDLFEIGPTEWAIMHGFASAEHHTWQYARVLSNEEYSAKSLEQDYLEQKYKLEKRPSKKATYQSRPEGMVEMVVENLTIAQKPNWEATGVRRRIPAPTEWRIRNMAHDTPAKYRNLVLYEVYVRNHGPNGTFADVEADLPRIKALGVDVVWCMPIHPIGKVKKKGSLGCPYSIADYRDVNPEYGGRDDFARLIDRAHELGLKVMIDVVYNHTAHDAVLVQEHPEWYRQNEDGIPVTTVPEWSDVIDLVHPNPALAGYLVQTLQMWADFGVDGFRCDVASLLPLGFWLRAREAVADVKPGVIWLAESVHAAWVAERRAAGYPMNSDSELYRAFDLSYDYDIWPIFHAAVKGKVPVARYLEMLRFQDCIYPANYVKMRCVENHDQPRIMALAQSREQALAWTAFEAFNKGAFLIYAGQEAASAHTPSLFDTDKVVWGGYPLTPFLTRLTRIKEHRAQMDGQFVIMGAELAVQTAWVHPGETLYGVFNLENAVSAVDVQLPDGEYTDLLSDAVVNVRRGQMPMPKSAVIVCFQGDAEYQPLYSHLLDYDVH